MAKKESGKKLTCICCNKTLSETSFYRHRNKFIIEDYSICKSCVESVLGNDITPENKDDFDRLLRLMDLPYVQKYVDSATNSNIKGKVGKYISMINSFVTDMHYEDGEIKGKYDGFTKIEGNSNTKEEIERALESAEVSSQNEMDCIRILKYDPFETYKGDDRIFLFNKLVDYLDDESIKNDGFRLSTVLEICQLFLQSDKINKALSYKMSDVEAIINKASEIKTISETKSKIIGNINSIAKDNGISINYNKSKTNKGAGTVSGIIKELNDKGIEESEVNMFDIETAKGMLQVAMISNEAIQKQNMWDENEYTEMIADQKKMIEDLDKRAEKAEEELRLLKVKLKNELKDEEL